MKKITVSALLLLAAGCTEIPAGAYFDRGRPEGLLDVSSEVVNMNVNSTASYAELATLVSQDRPTRAEINCNRSHRTCADAYDLFDRHEIPVESASGPEGITLIYERIVARDCENRFIDNSINPYNLHPPTFGCSVAANSVQMVTDKTQFTNPSLSDYQDAEKAVQNYRVYLRVPPPPSDDEGGSLLESIKTD